MSSHCLQHHLTLPKPGTANWGLMKLKSRTIVCVKSTGNHMQLSGASKYREILAIGLSYKFHLADPIWPESGSEGQRDDGKIYYPLLHKAQWLGMMPRKCVSSSILSSAYKELGSTSPRGVCLTVKPLIILNPSYQWARRGSGFSSLPLRFSASSSFLCYFQI